MPKYSGVYKDGNGWYFKLRVRDRSTGGWRQVTRRGYATAKEAHDARCQFESPAENLTQGADSRLTVTELVERYHADAEAMGELTERTLYDQRGYLRNSISPHLGDRPAADLRASDVRAWMVRLSVEGGKTGKGLSPNTVRLCRALLNKAYGWGVLVELLDENPVKRTDPPKLHKSIPEYWTPTQARQFLAFNEGDRLYPVWAFMLSVGVRPSEFVWLQWRNVDFENRRVLLQDFPTAIGWKLVKSRGKNDTAVRPVDIDDRLIEVLLDHRLRQQSEAARPGYEPSDYVFTKLNGGSYHPQTISKRLIGETKRARLPRLSAKGLRHTCATLMLAQGVPPKVAAERLGHSDTRMFSNVYSHVTPSMQQDAADRLGEALF